MDRSIRNGLLGFLGFVVAVALFMMFALPPWRVWSAQLEGEAVLEKAKSARSVIVEQARAEKEAAQMQADAIGIVGQAAKDFPEYRYQEFLSAFGEALREGTISQVLYIPTEAGVPILESGRLQKEVP